MTFLKIVITLLCTVLLLALPAAAAELEGGFYFVADCALGNGVRFYVPASAAEGCFTYDSNGVLVNISNSTVYIYAPAFPDHTFSAGRFSGFVYRDGSYTNLDLNVHNIRETNIEIYTENPVLQGEFDLIQVFHALIDVGCFAIAFLLLLKGGKQHV